MTHYNNFYEFGTGKEDPARNAHALRTSPWSVKVYGLVENPAHYRWKSSCKLAPLEERIYRHRCVEAWSIVVPWIGYSFNALLKKCRRSPKQSMWRSKAITIREQMLPGRMPE